MDNIRIPEAEYAVIGGSSTFSLNFPEDLEDSESKESLYDPRWFNFLAPG